MKDEDFVLADGTKVDLTTGYGPNLQKTPILLDKWGNGEGFIRSELDHRKASVNNQVYPQTADTSTLFATKNNLLKIILPYDNSGSHKLLPAAKYGFSLFKEDAILYEGLIDLAYYGGWKSISGKGVYERSLDEWFKEGEDGKLIGYNNDMLESDAHNCPLVLAKLGHPDEVDRKFWIVKGEREQSKDQVHKLINEIYRKGNVFMMGQYFNEPCHKALLGTWFVGMDCTGSRSSARSNLLSVNGQFPFVSVRDKKGK